jgi:hypothetical protein
MACTISGTTLCETRTQHRLVSSQQTVTHRVRHSRVWVIKIVVWRVALLPSVDEAGRSAHLHAGVHAKQKWRCWTKNLEEIIHASARKTTGRAPPAQNRTNEAQQRLPRERQ